MVPLVKRAPRLGRGLVVGGRDGDWGWWWFRCGGRDGDWGGGGWS